MSLLQRVVRRLFNILSRIQYIGLVALYVLATVGFGSIFFPQAAAAQGETYKWLNSTTIQGAGGHFVSPVNFTQVGQNTFSGTVQYAQACYIYAGFGARQTKAYFDLAINVDAAGIAAVLQTSTSSRSPSCDTGTSPPNDQDAEYNGKHIGIQGTRPVATSPTPVPPNPSGETYQWVSQSTIQGFGGHFLNPVIFIPDPSGIPNVFRALDIKYDNVCRGGQYKGRFGLQLTVLQGDSPGTLKVLPANDTVFGNPDPNNYGYACNTDHSGSDVVDPRYDNKTVPIGCQRTVPCQDATPETDDQRTVDVTFVGSKPDDPKATYPGTATITVKTSDGATVVGQPQTVAVQVGDQQILYFAHFTLDPGDYQVCATVVVKSCQPFTKVKYVRLALNFGITDGIYATINITVGVGCAEEISQFGPLQIILGHSNPFSAAGYVPDDYATTDVAHGYVKPVSTCNFGSAERQFLVLHAQFPSPDYDLHNILKPGQYVVCVPYAGDLQSDVCENVTKETGKSANVTINLTYSSQQELYAAAGSGIKTCTVGNGWAGNFAYGLCVAARLIIQGLQMLQDTFYV